jgi:hypothetical protein
MPRPNSPRAIQAELYSLSADLLAPTDGLSAENLATQALDIFGPRILPSDHLVASFVAHGHENRRMTIYISPLNNLTTIFLGDDILILSYLPPARSLPECVDDH